MPLLENHVILPLLEGKVQQLWHNNNAESANAVLKHYSNWKKKPLPDLVHCLSNLVTVRFVDMKRALSDQGNFILSATFRLFEHSSGRWEQLSDAEKLKAFDSFLRAKQKPGAKSLILPTAVRKSADKPKRSRPSH